jgi:hypothetical protein
VLYLLSVINCFQGLQVDMGTAFAGVESVSCHPTMMVVLENMTWRHFNF